MTDEFLEEMQRHFTDAEISEIGYFVMAYGGAHNFLSSIGERVLDDEGNDISDAKGFPLVFETLTAESRWQSPEEAAIDGPLPPPAGAGSAAGRAHAHRPSRRSPGS